MACDLMLMCKEVQSGDFTQKDFNEGSAESALLML